MYKKRIVEEEKNGRDGCYTIAEVYPPGFITAIGGLACRF